MANLILHSIEYRLFRTRRDAETGVDYLNGRFRRTMRTACQQKQGGDRGGLNEYAESDAGVLTHLAQSAYASLTGMLSVLSQISEERAP